MVLVRYPFTNLESFKQRPALVISKYEDNKISDDIITCGITSNLTKNNHSILINNKDLDEGFIPKESKIKVDKIFTLEKSIIKRKIGKLNTKKITEVKKEFCELI